MRKLLLTIMFLSMASLVFAKDIVVTGIIKDDLGETLAGASVIVKGTTIGSTTNLDGEYSIKVPEGHTILMYQFIGLISKEIHIPKDGGVVNVTLDTEDKMLDEVVVTGYGTYKKSAYAGSATTVKLENMEDVPAVDFSTMLQGNAPGVQISSNSGQPGSATDIMIRGLGSFNASKSPLYVIDGVPVISGNINRNDVEIGTDAMSTINPSDIENITVIKDAAAASLYGSRAANGVILITTKSGKQGKGSFNLRTDWGFSDFATDYREIMGGEERRETLYEGLMNKWKYENSDLSKGDQDLTAEEYASKYIDKYAPIPAGGYADWEKALFRKGFHQNYEFSATGGDKKMSYYTSLGYKEQEGITYQSFFRRISGRVNVKYQMTEQIELGANILFSTIKQDMNSEGGTYTAPMYATRHKVSPSDHIYNEDGTYNTELLVNKRRNPKAASDYNFKTQQADRSFNTIYVNYRPIKPLLFHSTLSYDKTYTKYRGWNDPRSSDGESDNGRLSRGTQDFRQLVWKNNGTFTKEFAEKHNVDLLAGFELDMFDRDYVSTTRKNFPNPNNPQISNGAELSDGTGYMSSSRMVSYLTRANYNYMDKYFAGASVRIDGTSKLASSSRWGTFWSASGAWRISEEAFMESARGVLSETKLRASYGTNGNLPTDYFGYMNLVSYDGKYMAQPGIYEESIGDNNLKWEKNYNLNLGLDFRLFDRVGITFEYYNRQTKDLLMKMPTSGTTGFKEYMTNVGEVENQGVELNIDVDVLRKPVSWTSSLNLGHNKNKIKNLGGQKEIRTGPFTHRVGNPYYSFLVYEYTGINPSNGRPLFFKNTGDNPRELTEDPAKEAEQILYKSADPTLEGGWTNTVRYKFIDLSFTFSFSLGGYSYDYGSSKLAHSGSEAAHNIQSYYRDRWKGPGHLSKYEVFITNGSSSMTSIRSSRTIHSTDHLRLKNMTVGFTMPKNIARAAKLENVRFYCSAVNLLTFAAYDGYDPEVPRDGRVYFLTPPLKTITFGLDIKF